MGKTTFNFGMALKEARLRANLSQEELAFQSELDRTYVSMLERNVKAPTITTLIKIAEALSITPTNLMAMAEKAERIARIEHSRKEKVKIPFMGTAISCGMPVTEDYAIEKEISLDELIRHPKKTFFIKATGDSMNPTISDGDLLVFELASRAKNGEVILVQIDNDFMVKRYHKTQTETKLIPDNPLFKEIEIDHTEQALICGILVGVIRLF